VPPGLRAPSDTPPPPAVVVDLDEVTNGLGSPGDLFAEWPSTEAYDPFVERGWELATREPLSTFSIDVDTASYANVRRFLNEGSLPPPGAVRVEEMVNYFPYAYDGPRGTVPFAVHLEVAQCPWALEHRLVRIGIKGRTMDARERPASNLTFLLDVSGSMNHPNKLPLVRESLKLLVENLRADDRVAIVVYAGASGLVLPPTPGGRTAEIVAAIDSLTPGGSTNGASGIRLAYETAQQAFVKGGNNRVILCTDGDFNVGVTSQDELVRLIEEKRRSGVYLTVLGYGMGNYKDATLEKLADKGNGNYGYVDSIREARKLLVEEATQTLFTIAKDVKIQVEFNPAHVAGYRLVGYDNRRLAAQDFNDDTKDAGEIGAGHTVTAFYEVIPAGKPVPGATVDPLKYQAAPEAGAVSPEVLTLKMRWKAPEADVSEKIEVPLVDGGLPYVRASGEFKFAAAVAAFAQILRQSAFRGTASLEGVVELAGESVGSDPGGHRAELLQLVAKARALAPGR
jgi:Ca-activated chloride channel family protein